MGAEGGQRRSSYPRRLDHLTEVDRANDSAGPPQFSSRCTVMGDIKVGG
jgi:hypothetical protein